MALGKRTRWALRLLAGTALVAAWIAALAYGSHVMMTYDTTAGRSAKRAPAVSSSKVRAWTCVMVVHPDCPCTRASLSALREIVARYNERVEFRIVMVSETPRLDSPNFEAACKIPEAAVSWITPQRADELYDSYTSGQAFILDRNGDVAFSGGITPGRGTDKPEFALQLFESVLAGKPVRKSSPVYGCELQTEEK
jgi:hypothetical protein